MHSALASQIQSVHADLRRLIGVLVPDLDHELRLQTHQDAFLVAVPPAVEARFARAAWGDTTAAAASPRPLRDLADAFVAHWERSIVGFVGGLLVETRTPAVDKWLALLKCVWLMGHMRTAAAAEPPSSHWPSYVRQLESVSVVPLVCGLYVVLPCRLTSPSNSRLSAAASAPKSSRRRPWPSRLPVPTSLTSFPSRRHPTSSASSPRTRCLT
jgi:hypothetical protein